MMALDWKLDSDLVVTRSIDKTIKICDTREGKVIYTFEVEGKKISLINLK